MFRHRSKLVHMSVVIVFLTMSASWWLLLGASATYASTTYPLATPTAGACPTPSNILCITNTPTTGLTLNGIDQTVPYTLAFTVNNATSGNWHVTITSTRFATGSHTLSQNASSVTGVTVVSACSGSTCPVNAIVYPVNLVAGTPATFYDNTSGGSHGVGIFNLQATIQVAVPANIYAGTYNSTITIAFASGP